MERIPNDLNILLTIKLSKLIQQTTLKLQTSNSSTTIYLPQQTLLRNIKDPTYQKQLL